MSMIFFACVVRVRDGLPLSASTDFHFSQDFLECRKRLKALSAILARYPSRGTARGRDLSIHFLSSGDIACMAICSSNYSTIMAFCFLEELQWEFAASYDTTSIGLASRPYAFLEFDNVIQKVKYRFNCSSGSRMKANWEKMEEELKFQPPVQLKLEDTELMNGMTNGGHAGVHVEVVPTYRMQRVTPLGILSLVLNIMCGALNLIRGVHLAEYSFQEDHEGIGNVVAFFIPFLACVFQCYLYLFYSSARKVKTFVLFFSVCLCNVYLYGLRNLWQIAFHIGVASLSSYQILTRQLVEKQPDCGV
ncbi:vesicle-trafficking protein SEC22c [Cuculus canorus]|uniref:Vesicle-trafficking protein SEC22c n=1 Tax=Cuculus canorus TaxID=55661 RepID=A0A091FX55_CUCCA|nr:vesicle-trafficking protein SEC22c [Cuculus canorus]XP_053915527.1 vesicle-trafficking protein SEC22c [Cuculus canorus]XP_053915528.1 vesicle-trafficking protein SEC22c [Cuculus canorus]XP_053915529.1 vesicle-trafficking protein SEC22c [Cuculus canorus]XP_053915530.1 vesicle-trafficking protein SEC22c [Cuculus canorus]KFO74203.1 Vesicle-trafficking protein SEC22c [Cuculus canorus]